MLVQNPPIHMSIQPAELFRLITDESTATSRAVVAAADLNNQRAQRISKLVNRQTNAFVELSQHYLPDLSHESLQDAWQEVREEIREVLLVKDDQRRALLARSDRQQARRAELQEQLDQVQAQLAHAKLVLGCKTGNFKKTLREDPKIISCGNRIAQLDEEIECCLEQLDTVEVDASRKLPDYEACSLFQYLREQGFGTSDYQSRGIERHWDRWVAKLIDFGNVHKSFKYLTEAPGQLKSLIEEKQTQYRQLLRELETARADALCQFDVLGQTDTWHELNQQAESLEAEIDRVQWQESMLCDQIYDIENMNGQHYDRAIEVYRRFLAKLDPEILRVYAACTESPVDDQICARVRRFQADIGAERKIATDRHQQIVDSEKYLSGLRELAGRLRNHLRQTPANLLVRGDFHFGDALRKMRQNKLSPGEVWRRIRKSMTHGDATPLPSSHVSRRHASSRRWSTRPLDASFMAASESLTESGSLKTRSRATPTPIDSTGIVIMPPAVDSNQSELGFSTLAICRDDAEATFVSALLMTHAIDCFVHTQAAPEDEYSQNSDNESEMADDVHVMVPTRMFGQAREVVVQHQQSRETAWQCGACDSHVDAGYGLCWQCGLQR